MNILFIDTHLYDVNVILFRNGVVVKNSVASKEIHNSSSLLPLIINVLDNESFDEIIVVNGPGSFTGLRTGITVAKTLAYTKKIPIKTVNYLEMMAYSLDDSENYVGIFDNSGVYVGHFKEYNLVADYFYLKNSEYEESSLKNDLKTSVVIDYGKVYKMLSKRSDMDPKFVNPIYIKKISAEL